MFVFSFNIKKAGKYALIAALALGTVIFAAAKVRDARAVPVAKSAYQDIAGNEERREFLARFGWETTAEPEETVAVSVPETLDGAYAEYAELQTSQGFSLESFRGKTLTRYTYGVTNYEGQPEGTVKANLLMSGTTVVGGDICSVLSDGFIHGFAKPQE